MANSLKSYFRILFYILAPVAIICLVLSAAINVIFNAIPSVLIGFMLFIILPSLLLVTIIRIIFCWNQKRDLAKEDQKGVSKNGEPYEWKHTVMSKFNDPWRSTLSINAPSPIKFRLVRKNDPYKLAVRLGLLKKSQTGDREFDEKIYIETRYPVVCAQLSREKQLQYLVMKLFAFGISLITLEKNCLILTFDPPVPYLSEEALEQNVNNLVALRQGLVAGITLEEAYTH